MTTSRTSQATVVLADDHAVVRSGLRLLLARSGRWQVIGEASTAEQAVRAVEQLAPDVLLLDINMPGGSGLSAIGRVVRVSPQTRVIVLTMHRDTDFARAALRAGARGYVLKEAAAEELIVALEQVQAGGLYVQPSVGASLAAGTDAQSLTPREREVLSLLAQGNTNEEISAQLHFSVRTVEGHRARLREKLGLRTRAELAGYAREHGL